MEQNTEVRYKPTSGDNYTVTKPALIHDGEKTASQQIALGKLELCAKESNGTTLTPCTKIETIKPLEENVGSMFFDISFCNYFGSIFLDKEIKAEIKKWDYNKLNIFAP